MSEWHQIIWTSVFTIIGGVVIFTAGHIVLKFFIEPIQEMDKVRGKICDTLIFSKTFI